VLVARGHDGRGGVAAVTRKHGRHGLPDGAGAAIGQGGIQYLRAAASQDVDGDGTMTWRAVSSPGRPEPGDHNWAAGAKQADGDLGGFHHQRQFGLSGRRVAEGGATRWWLDSFQSSNGSAIVRDGISTVPGYTFRRWRLPRNGAHRGLAAPKRE